jgi:hypothetical protein
MRARRRYAVCPPGKGQYPMRIDCEGDLCERHCCLPSKQEMRRNAHDPNKDDLRFVGRAGDPVDVVALAALQALLVTLSHIQRASLGRIATNHSGKRRMLRELPVRRLRE